MLDNAPVENISDRPIKKAQEILELPRGSEIKALVKLEDLLKIISYHFPYSITKRTFQLYGSPRFRLMPPPIFKGGHVAYYLYPEHVERLAIVMQLREKYYMPLQKIADILEHLPREHYPLIARGQLTAQDIADSAHYMARGYGLRDVIFFKIGGLFDTLYEDSHILSVPKSGEKNEEPFEKGAIRRIARFIREFIKWLKSGRLRDMLYGNPEEELSKLNEMYISQQDPNDPKKVKLVKVDLRDKDSVRKATAILKAQKRGEDTRKIQGK
ncbi:hypothetical protein ACFL6Y_10610 [Elusimicrobiota bacterium]